MMLFLFKLIITPVLVALMSLAARAWGPTVGGLIMGLPWMTGPILFFLGLERGEGFVAHASVGVLLGTIGIAAFLLAFTTAGRRIGWLGSLAVGVVTYLLTGLLTSRLAPPVWLGGCAAATSLLIVYCLIPKGPPLHGPRALPWWDIPMRMFVTGLLVTLISLTADVLGPLGSGIAASFPVIFVVVGGFTLARWGPVAAAHLARGVSLSLLSFTAFFATVGSTIEWLSLTTSFLLGGVVAVLISGSLIGANRILVTRRSKAGA
jgi:hypothetical protein